MDRIPEDEIMDDWEQARAYAQADFSDANSLFVELLIDKFPLFQNGRVVDLGCGPADVLIRLCAALPAVRALGVDGSQAMIELAQRAVAKAELQDRIELICADALGLSELHGKLDAVLSNSLLHHLPDPIAFWRQCSNLARPQAPLLVMDLIRPQSPDAARQIVERCAAHDPEILQRDFYNSLLAAYTIDEVRGQLADAGLEHVEVAKVSDRHLAAWRVA
ncbi:MAG: class I SAM-dependent methyltransferase [Candidatus Alcyoniella australis]|nr:class I SAM-dependent methyltransferase [Candidatus Alcyoniella australis]